MRQVRLVFASVCAVAPIAFSFGQAAKGGNFLAQSRGSQPQASGRRSMMMGGGMMLIANEKVQKDMGLTAAQVKTLTTKAGQIFPGMAPGSQRGNTRPPQLNPSDLNKKVAEYEALVKKTLSAAQQTRLKQLMYQQRGFRAWTEPDVAAKLALTAAQKDKMKKIQEQSRDAMRKMFQGAQGSAGKSNAKGNQPPPRADFSKMDEMRKKEEAQMMGILTAKQKATWTAMLGKKLDLQSGWRMGGRGGPGGPPPTGGRGGR